MPKRNLKIGDVVIVQDEVSRNEWPLAVVTETSMNQEGLVRAVKVKLRSRNPRKGSDYKCSVVERPVQKVVLLLESVD